MIRIDVDMSEILMVGISYFLSYHVPQDGSVFYRQQ